MGIEKVRRYAALLRHWSHMVTGTSYWHQQQGMGRCYSTQGLAGYFNDLTGKTRWGGAVDDNGLPLLQAPNGNTLYWPTTIFQSGLGHWDSWLLSERRCIAHRSAFLRVAEWALRAQDVDGGWPLWPQVGLNYLSPYSAMTQGEGISVLVRAFELTGERIYLEGARRAMRPMTESVENGGTMRNTPDGPVLEEYPLKIPKTVLNGWIFALFGLHDLLLVDDSAVIQSFLDRTLNALAVRLHAYDAGYWSYYDSQRNLASPFYHQLHIAQLEALERTFPQTPCFGEACLRFTRYLQSPSRRTAAVVIKAYQKLRHPPDLILR